MAKTPCASSSGFRKWRIRPLTQVVEPTAVAVAAAVAAAVLLEDRAVRVTVR